MRLPFELYSAMLGAEPLRSRKGVKAVLQRAGTREAGSEEPYFQNGKPSVQPPAKRIAGVAIGEGDGKGKRSGRVLPATRDIFEVWHYAAELDKAPSSFAPDQRAQSFIE